MKRRSLIFSPLALVMPQPAQAGLQPWSAKLLQGGFDGKTYWAGLAISLMPNWKTYWRVPGDGGIAPQIQVTGENLKSFHIDYPAPKEYFDEAGRTIGYKTEVVFPIALESIDAAKPLQILLSSFFGVCDVVCIPAKFDDTLNFDPANATDQNTISMWRSKVPQHQNTGPVLKASAKMVEDKPVLYLDLSESVSLLLVEGNPLHYFSSPMLMRGLARITVSGAKTLEDLKQTPLRITVVPRSNGSIALEQVITID